jgi:hypothetical protein
MIFTPEVIISIQQIIYALNFILCPKNVDFFFQSTNILWAKLILEKTNSKTNFFLISVFFSKFIFFLMNLLFFILFVVQLFSAVSFLSTFTFPCCWCFFLLFHFLFFYLAHKGASRTCRKLTWSNFLLPTTQISFRIDTFWKVHWLQ